MTAMATSPRSPATKNGPQWRNSIDSRERTIFLDPRKLTNAPKRTKRGFVECVLRPEVTATTFVTTPFAYGSYCCQPTLLFGALFCLVQLDFVEAF